MSNWRERSDHVAQGCYNQNFQRKTLRAQQHQAQLQQSIDKHILEARRNRVSEDLIQDAVNSSAPVRKLKELSEASFSITDKINFLMCGGLPRVFEITHGRTYETVDEQEDSEFEDDGDYSDIYYIKGKMFSNDYVDDDEEHFEDAEDLDLSLAALAIQDAACQMLTAQSDEKPQYHSDPTVEYYRESGFGDATILSAEAAKKAEELIDTTHSPYPIRDKAIPEEKRDLYLLAASWKLQAIQNELKIEGPSVNGVLQQFSEYCYNVAKNDAGFNEFMAMNPVMRFIIKGKTLIVHPIIQGKLLSLTDIDKSREELLKMVSSAHSITNIRRFNYIQQNVNFSVKYAAYCNDLKYLKFAGRCLRPPDPMRDSASPPLPV